MAQLCLWTKILTKQRFILGASAFQCMRPGFLCPKCDNFACIHTRQDQNELHLKRWFFLPSSVIFGIFCKSIAGPLPIVAQVYTQPYLLGGRIKLIICQIMHELSVTIHKVLISWQKKRYMADAVEFFESLNAMCNLRRFLTKTLRVNKMAMKTFSKNLSFGVDFKL